MGVDRVQIHQPSSKEQHRFRPKTESQVGDLGSIGDVAAGAGLVQ